MYSELKSTINDVVYQGVMHFDNYATGEEHFESQSIANLCADLFAGVGGIGLGFSRAGFQSAFAIDIEPTCKLTYDLNHIDPKLNLQDIGHIDIASLPSFDILLAGFPCQPFSVAGYRKGFEDAERGNQFFNLFNILKERRPRAILMENVKNLKTHDNGNTFRVIEESLHSLGYFVNAQILNSMTHGNVPQTRERIFIAGFLSRYHFEKFCFPEKTPLVQKLPDCLEKTVPESYYYEGKPLHSKLVDSVKRRDTVYQFRRHYVRENKKGVCPTLTANMGMGGTMCQSFSMKTG